MDIKENFYSNLQQLREEQLDEISHKRAREAEDKAAEVYHGKYDDETDARKNFLRNKTPENKKKADDAGESRKKAAKRVIRFQKYADKKKEKLEEVTIKTAIKAYRTRKDRADDFYSEPNDGKKAAKTLARIEKKHGIKIAADAAKPDKEYYDTSQDYLSAKQDVYSKFSRPKSKKGTKERKEYMKMNKGRFAKKK